VPLGLIGGGGQPLRGAGDGGGVVYRMGKAGGFGFAAITLLRPTGLFLVLLLLMIGAPGGIALLRLNPELPVLIDPFALTLPIRFCHGFMPIAQRCLIQRLGPRQVTPGNVCLALRGIARHHIAVGVIDHDQGAVAVAIGIVGILHQIRLIGAGLVEIVAQAAVGQLLGHALRTIVGAPCHGLLAVIIISEIGRSIGDGLALRISLVEIVIVLAGGLDIGDRRGRRRQLGGGGRRRGGGRGAGGKRQRRQGRRRGVGCRIGAVLVGLAAAGQHQRRNGAAKQQGREPAAFLRCHAKHNPPPERLFRETPRYLPPRLGESDPGFLSSGSSAKFEHCAATEQFNPEKTIELKASDVLSMHRVVGSGRRGPLTTGESTTS